MSTITDGRARAIASDWHGGQTSPLYSLSSCGAIDNLDRLRWEISANLETLPVGKPRRELLALDKYARTAGQRGPVEGWNRLRWDFNTRVTVEDY